MFWKGILIYIRCSTYTRSMYVYYIALNFVSFAWMYIFNLMIQLYITRYQIHFIAVITYNGEDENTHLHTGWWKAPLGEILTRNVCLKHIKGKLIVTEVFYVKSIGVLYNFQNYIIFMECPNSDITKSLFLHFNNLF